MKSYRVIALFLAIFLMLSACNAPTTRSTEQVNPNAIFTAAAQTVEVQLTQNALLNSTNQPATIGPPINTPISAVDTPLPPVIVPTANSGTTATSAPVVAPTSACDAAKFVNDVSIQDGTVFAGGATFTKTWRLQNVGTCTWNSSYALVFDSGDAMGGTTSLALTGSTAPGATLDVSVNLQAPVKDGTYRGFWGLINASGARIPVQGGTNGKSFYVDIKVGTGSGGVSTDSPGKFAVVVIEYSFTRSEACSSATGKYIISAIITTNKAGTVTYSWVPSDTATGPKTSGSISFDSAGSKTISTEWVTTQTNLWVDLYIDNPNHQQYGRATLTCP